MPGLIWTLEERERKKGEGVGASSGVRGGRGGKWEVVPKTKYFTFFQILEIASGLSSSWV
jgi:hypothetical protein